jgi:ABC-type multidrug transport system fused ATPase/permease subunit
MKLFTRVYYLTLKIAPVSAVAALFASLVQGLLPAFQTKLLERIFDSSYGLYNCISSIGTPLRYCAVFLLVYGVVKAVEFSLSITVNAGVYEKCNSFHRVRIAEKTAALPLVSLEDSAILDLQEKSKTCVNREAISTVYMSSALFIINIVGLVSLAAVLGSYHVVLIPVSIISAVPFFIAAALRGREFYFLKQGQAKKSRLLRYLWSLFSDQQVSREMRVMGFGGYLTEKWRKTKTEVNEELWRQEMKDARSLLVCDAIKIAAYIASIVLALLLTLRGEISIGLFGACVAAFKSVQDVSKELLTQLGRLPERVGFVKDYFSYLDLAEEAGGGGGKITAIEEVTARGISFRYPNVDAYAVRDVSLSIKRGETVVILGENGSGKTTLIKLLLGMYPLDTGTVAYNAVPLEALNKAGLYEKVSIVAQNFVRYKLTLRENVAISAICHQDEVGRGRVYNYGIGFPRSNSPAEDQAIEEALRLSGAADVLEVAALHARGDSRAASNLDIVLGREFGGVELSGGQWQKLAISRGIFRDSDLIILDEPTAALDPIIEREVLTGFLKIARGKSAIIISHRVGLCALADKIIVMKDGRVIETGAHRDLLPRGGEYTRLYTSQAQWYGKPVQVCLGVSR